jgi:GST-like protein
MKAALLLEELGLPFEVTAVDTFRGAQHKPEYLAINPNGKVPAIVDDGVAVFDSHAILLHLSTKHGKFVPTAPAQHSEMFSWLLFIASGLSPFSGQAVHFLHHAPETIPYARNRYVKGSRTPLPYSRRAPCQVEVSGWRYVLDRRHGIVGLGQLGRLYFR